MKRWDLSSLLYRIAWPAALMVMGLILMLNPDSLSALISTVLGWGLLAAGVCFIAAAVLSRFGTLRSVLGALVCLTLAAGCSAIPWCWRRASDGLQESCC